MTDNPNDAPEGAEKGHDGTPWQPATDAGSEKDLGRDAGSGRKARRPSPAKEVPVRLPAEPEPEPVAAEPATEGAPEETFAGERIAKAIARAGLASRRDAEAMIREGRVSVNGAVIDSPALNVTEDDVILVDGEPLPTKERTRLWIFHKPRGLVTTARDPEGRQTVFEVLPEDMPRVVAVGRLDINTEGLLLLTNDGGLAKVIAHPDTGWLRRYRVRAHGDTDQAQLDRLSKGVTIDGMEYGPVEATLDRVQGDNLWLTLGLREGKNREVKRILEHLGLQVNRLIRLSFGPFQLGDLESGLVEEVRTRVLKDQLGKSLSEQAGVDFESPVREPITPFGGPAPQRGDGGAKAQPRRDAARPAPQRVSTGGTGSGPRRSVWRADGEERTAPRVGRVPRRGGDPREAQAAAAERGRERVGAIKAGDRRVLVERLSPTPPKPVAEEAPRRRYSKAPAARQDFAGSAPQAEGRPARAPARSGAPQRDSRPPRSFDEGGQRPPRSFEGGQRPPRSSEGGQRPPRARPFEGQDGSGPRRNDRGGPAGRESHGPSRDRGERNEGFAGRRSDDRRPPRADNRGASGKPAQGRSEGKPFAGKSFAGKSFGGKPSGGKSFGERPAGRPAGGKPGGSFRSGPKPGGSGGGFKGGGGKPGGSKGGGRPPRGAR